MTASTPRKAPNLGCESCIMRGLGLCDVLASLGWERSSLGEQGKITQHKRPFAARRSIFHQNESLDGVPIVCEGWAASVLKLSNGRRLILSFLLPGEIVACGPLPRLHSGIDAVTRGCCRLFDRAQLKAAVSVSPAIFDTILSACNDANNRADQLIVDLGRRTAVERVARLLLDIWDRMEKSDRVKTTASISRCPDSYRRCGLPHLRLCQQAHRRISRQRHPRNFRPHITDYQYGTIAPAGGVIQCAGAKARRLQRLGLPARGNAEALNA
jgi:CRP-like cAMP-binding protein